MSTTTIIQTRVATEDKKKAEDICRQLGLSLNDALRMVVRTIVNTQSIPAKLNLQTSNERLPDPQELQAIEEFLENPQLIGTEESARFLNKLKKHV